MVMDDKEKKLIEKMNNRTKTVVWKSSTGSNTVVSNSNPEDWSTTNYTVPPEEIEKVGISLPYNHLDTLVSEKVKEAVKSALKEIIEKIDELC